MKQLILIGGVVAFFVIAPLTGMGSTQDGDINDDFSLGDHRHRHEHHHSWDAGGLNERFADAVRPRAEAWIHDHVHLQFGEREDTDENAGLPRYVTQMQHAKDLLADVSKSSIHTLSDAARQLDKIERDIDARAHRGDADHRSDDVPSVAARGSAHSAVDWMRNILPRSRPVVDESRGADDAGLRRRTSTPTSTRIPPPIAARAPPRTPHPSPWRGSNRLAFSRRADVREVRLVAARASENGCACAAVWEGRGCKTTRSLGARAPGVVSGFKRGFLRRDPDDARERPGHDRDPREPRGALGDEAHRKTLGVDPRALPEEDPLDRISFARCAVVGGGGSLLTATYGAEIDAHDAVFRFDKHPTVGYETHVGRKTTHRVVNGAAVGFRERDSETVLQSYRTTRAFKQFLSRKRRAPTERLHAIHPDFLAWTHESFALRAGDGTDWRRRRRAQVSRGEPVRVPDPILRRRQGYVPRAGRRAGRRL